MNNSKDILKYVTVYENVLPRELCDQLIESFYSAPHGGGYILEEAN